MAKAPSKQQSEDWPVGFTKKPIVVNRVTKVVKGGRILSFSALVVVGNGKGRVGIGKGKAKEVSLAVQKALDKACRNLIDVPLINSTLLHSGKAKHGASTVFFRPGGEGVICSPSLRAVFQAAGIQNVVAKIHGSTNPHNAVRALLSGLSRQKTLGQVQAARGRSRVEAVAQ